MAEPTRLDAKHDVSFFVRSARNVAEPTRLELATSAVTGQRSNQLSYDSVTSLYTILSYRSTRDIILFSMAIKVTRKDQGEANENIIRRFNRKDLKSGMMPLKKSQMRFSKPISKRERRVKAIIREARKAEKTERIKLGLK